MAGIPPESPHVSDTSGPKIRQKPGPKKKHTGIFKEMSSFTESGGLGSQFAAAGVPVEQIPTLLAVVACWLDQNLNHQSGLSTTELEQLGGAIEFVPGSRGRFVFEFPVICKHRFN